MVRQVRRIDDHLHLPLATTEEGGLRNSRHPFEGRFDVIVHEVVERPDLVGEGSLATGHQDHPGQGVLIGVRRQDDRLLGFRRIDRHLL